MSLSYVSGGIRNLRRVVGYSLATGGLLLLLSCSREVSPAPYPIATSIPTPVSRQVRLIDRVDAPLIVPNGNVVAQRKSMYSVPAIVAVSDCKYKENLLILPDGSPLCNQGRGIIFKGEEENGRYFGFSLNTDRIDKTPLEGTGFTAKLQKVEGLDTENQIDDTAVIEITQNLCKAPEDISVRYLPCL